MTSWLFSNYFLCSVIAFWVQFQLLLGPIRPYSNSFEQLTINSVIIEFDSCRLISSDRKILKFSHCDLLTCLSCGTPTNGE